MLEDMKISELLEIVKLFNYKSEKSQVNFWKVGKSYFIRTVTMHIIGTLVEITDKELLLKNASWIADSGRFYDALKNGELNEVEPFIDDIILNRDCIIDATFWDHKNPTEQK